MDADADFAKAYHWETLLEPSLSELGLSFVQFVLIVCLQPNTSYLGFLDVKHTSSDESTYGIWFSNYVKVLVEFRKEIRVTIKPVHFRREILDWNRGEILVDNRT
jgi:hypothetical protein